MDAVRVSAFLPVSLLAGVMVYWTWGLAGIPSGAGRLYFAVAIAGILLLHPRSARLDDDLLEPRSPLRSEIAVQSFAVLFLVLEAAWRWVGNWKLWMGVLLLSMLSVRAGGAFARLNEEWNEGRLTPRRVAWLLGIVLFLIQAVLFGWVWGERFAAGMAVADLAWMGKAVLACGLYAAAAAYAVYKVLQRDTRRRLAAGSLAAVLALNPLLPSVLRSRWGMLAGVVLVTAGALAIASAGPESRLFRRETVFAFGVPWWLATGVLLLPAAWTPDLWELYGRHAWPLLAALAASVAAAAGAAVIPASRGFFPLMMTGILLIACAPFLLPQRVSPGVFHPPQAAGSERVLQGEQVILSIRNPEHRLPVSRGADSRVVRISLSLANAMGVDQGASVGEILFTGDGGFVERVSLRAGIDAAEWAIDRRDVAMRVKHRRPPPGESWIVWSPNGESFVAHRYYIDIPFEGRNPGEIRFRWSQPGGEKDALLNIHKVSIRENPADTPG